ncbi:MAG: rod shape-determining protein MreD [Bacteroidaceae bacterium]|nr:rod shape-determining protein MreD [Bacteroidaceae bacterium]
MNTIKHILLSLLILAVQVLVLNHVHIMGYAIPMLCIYPILLFPLETARWKVLLFSFAMGFLTDMFSNTPGLSSATFTLIGMIQPHLLGFFLPHEEESASSVWPSFSTLGGLTFTRYVLLATLIQSICFFVLESFSFSNYQHLAISAASSWALTSVFILAVESIRSGSSKDERK